jgi:hypothetical protein
MPTKLHINLSQGVLDVEGEESFVKSIYEDFREEALKNFSSTAKPDQAPGATPQAPAGGGTGGTKKRAAGKKTSAGKTKSSDYKPKFKSDLDLSGLKPFYDQFAPKNHSEKILIFAQFLSEQLGIDPCAADDIYSCYFTLKTDTRTPQAFVQALRDAQKHKGYINFNSLEDINVSIAGSNHFHQGLKRK